MENKIFKKNFDVQSIGINTNHKEVFDFVAKPENLPLWTKAFTKADNKSATMVTPNGELSIEMETIVSKDSGTVDWVMTMQTEVWERHFQEFQKMVMQPFIHLFYWHHLYL